MRLSMVLGSLVVFAIASPPSAEEVPSSESQASAAGISASDKRVERANAAMNDLQTRLLKALTAELEKGGPAVAIDVCREDAPVIAEQVAGERGLELGRTSHRLRNPKNAPRPWARRFVEEAAGKKFEGVEAHFVDLGDKIGVLRPINTMELCTRCHGTAERISPEARQDLASSYPEDQAVGFDVGDLRGWMWAEVPKR